ncbi:CHAT domain-containing protein, partial [Nostoc flagelliforme FACHB-838]
MQKLVVLKLDGNLNEGVKVTLEIGAEGDRASVEVQGYLPLKPEIIADYQLWRTTYRSLSNFRITPVNIHVGTSLNEHLNKCRELNEKLSERMNSWLNCNSFRPVKEKLLKQLTLDDTVRILIKTSDTWLRRLPWHLWDFLEDYQKAEVALSAPEYEYLPKPKTTTIVGQVKILAILGNSEGILIDKDRELLEMLPDAETTFLVEPQRSQLNEQLWKQDWDILFFAGHSESLEDGKSGNIYINETDCLTIEQLKYALKKAVSQGLQLAIFNSCDGLGLASQLEDLHIPQIIVMREPVQDLVAQEFLKNFLRKFSSGESMYLAVREAREKLHGIEDQYPCAVCLPIICQNPAAVPPAWKDFLINPQTENGKPQI